MVGYTDQVLDEFLAVTGHRPFSELRDGMTPEQRAAADGKVQALAAQPMTYTMKLTTIGVSTGVILPPELVARLGVRVGDNVYATEMPDGIILTASPPTGS